MNFSWFRHDAVICFASLLLAALGTSGCGQKLRKAVIVLDCGDKTVVVDPNSGVIPSQTAVWVCDDDTVTWDGNGHEFKVEFKDKSPFTDNEKVFHNKHPKSFGAKHLTHLEVFEYRITVDGKSFDPQVVGGGGHSN